MADIDKGLPKTRTKIDIPSDEEMAEEVNVQEEESQKGPVEVLPEEDGGATIDFEPGAINIPGTESHFDNLADILPDDVLDPLGSELKNNYTDYKMSRKDWEQSYMEGLDLLGFKYNNRTEPFQGASGATHPVLAEAVTQFQSMAYKELLPSDGPVRTQILGAVNPQKEQQAQRVKDFMNYQIMDQMQAIADAGGVANLAGGGIAKVAGVDKGPAPVSGPNPQGLQRLFKRANNL